MEFGEKVVCSKYSWNTKKTTIQCCTIKQVSSAPNFILHTLENILFFLFLSQTKLYKDELLLNFYSQCISESLI